MEKISNRAATSSGIKGARKTGRVQTALLGGVSVLAMALAGFAAQAQDGPIEEMVVKVDRVGIFENKETDSVFGLTRTPLETPRSFSTVSDTTILRYGIEDIDDFITTTPGTFGGSFFGVPGVVTVRGSRADNYFRGFKKAVNNGFFPTPVGSSAEIEIIRGPAPAIYGAGRIGGLMNFYPKTTKSENLKAADGAQGYIAYTGGSYNKNKATVEVSLPFLVGGRETGVALYAEYEDSKSFYRNREPEHQLVQLSLSHDLPNDISIEAGGMFFHSEGYYQTPGWNRVTQDLIDNSNYITGRDVDLVDLDGNGRLTPNEVDAAVGTFFGASNIRTLVDFGVFFIPPAYGLDVGVGTAKLDRRTVFLTPNDEVQNSDNLTLYFDIVKELDDSTLKLQFFYDRFDAKIGVSSGFAAEHQMNVFEARLSYDFNLEMSDFAKVDVFTTASHRIYDSKLRENFLSGYLVLDRRDLVNGPTGNDIFDTPFTVEPGGINIPWDSNFDNKWTDTGIAIVTDIRLWENLGILFNGRYDYYNAETINTGATVFDPTEFNTLFKNHEDDFSFSISCSYTFPFGIVPYVTYAEGSTVEENSNGGVSPSTVRSGSILADSELFEVGVKVSLLDDTLFGSVAYYDQKRTLRDPFGNIDGENGEGWEIELKYLINDNWTVTGAATIQEFKIAPPGACGSGNGEFVVIPPTHPTVNLFGATLTGPEGYGGIFAALNSSCLPELSGGYKRRTIPDEVYSAFITYTSDETQYGTFGATFGGTYVSETGGKTVTAVVLPDYTVFRAAAFVEYGRFSLTATIENLFDKRYFLPQQGVNEEIAVLPGTGREWRLTGKINF